VLLEPPAPKLSLHPPDRKKFEVVLDPKNPECLASVVRRYIDTIFDQCDGNKAKTAEALGVGRTTIYRKLGLRKD
jgi:DNA-binding NtrC family response regulator